MPKCGGTRLLLVLFFFPFVFIPLPSFLSSTYFLYACWLISGSTTAEPTHDGAAAGSTRRGLRPGGVAAGAEGQDWRVRARACAGMLAGETTNCSNMFVVGYASFWMFGDTEQRSTLCLSTAEIDTAALGDPSSTAEIDVVLGDPSSTPRREMRRRQFIVLRLLLLIRFNSPCVLVSC